MKFVGVVIGVFLLVLSGCDANDAGCISDSECRAGRTCQEGACTGEPAIVDLNNLPGQNNGQNNGENNGQNNGLNNGLNNGENNGANNGENNGVNNGDSCGGCPGNAVCEDGLCIEFCSENTDCRDDEACSSRFEAPGNQCQEADLCFVENFFAAEFEVCTAQFSCDRDGFMFVECANIDENVVRCFCEGENESNEFEAETEACSDIRRLEDLINQNCGTRIRDAFFVDG